MEIQTSEINYGGSRPPKWQKKVFAIFLLAVIFYAGLQVGKGEIELPKNKVIRAFINVNQDTGPQEVNWQILWDAIEKINEKYVNRPADMQKVLYGAVSGAVSALDDPYSVFLPPKEAKEFKDELAGTLEGIGAEIATKNQLLVVVSPLADSPAEKAGIKAGDYIQKIDGKETAGLAVDEAVGKIRGSAGTKVTLSVFHKGQTKPQDITITRAKIEVQSIESETKEVNGKKIGYIQIRRFGDDTAKKLEKIVSDFLVQNVSGVILDVRSNPGGFLEAAVDVASNWVSNGKIVVIQEFGSGVREEYKSEGQARLSGIPTAVLINGGSASASEIVAGALQDQGFAKLVGEKTFGKGSVQELIDLRDDAQVKLTIAKWLTPNGHDLNKDGLEPDEKIELKDEDFEADRDPQMDKAVEMLTE